LGKNGGEKASQEEATKDNGDEVPVQLWNSWLKKLWDRDVFPLLGVVKGAEVVREKFALRWWKMRVRMSFFRWFCGEFKLKTSHLRMITQESFWDLVRKQNRMRYV
jgi:hypothetical protein